MTTAVLAELERLEQLCAEATPGPWLTDVLRESGEITWQLHITTKHHNPMEHGRIQNEKNERFAATSREALPRLIAALQVSIEALGDIQNQGSFAMRYAPDATVIASQALAAIAQALGTEGSDEQ